MSMSFGTKINAGASGTKVSIQQAYASGAPYQWSIELWRNACQVIERAGLDPTNHQLMFDFCEFVLHGGPSVWKRRIWNDGPPMTPTELMEYFSQFGISGGGNDWSLVNRSGQYGQGSRSSILPHSGLMVLTTQPGGDTHVIAIADTGDDYALIQFTEEVENEDGEIELEPHELGVLDAGQDLRITQGTKTMILDLTSDLIDPRVQKKGGVTFILLGLDIDQDYVDGDPRKGEGGRMMIDALTARTHHPLPVTVKYMHKPTDGDTRTHGEIVSTVSRGVQKVDPRALKTYDDWFARVPAGNQDILTLDAEGTMADVYLLPEDWNLKGPYTKSQLAGIKSGATKKGTSTTFIEREPGKFYVEVPLKDSWFPHDGKGFVAVQYDNEMMILPGSKRTEVLGKWGITVESVANRTAMVITPPKMTPTSWGVTQNAARSALEGPNGSALPIDEWREAFYDQVPDFLKKAMLEATPKVEHRMDPNVLKRLKAAIKGRLNLNRDTTDVETRKKTKDMGDPTDETVGSGGQGRGGAGPGPGPGPGPKPGGARKVISKKKGAVSHIPRKVETLPEVIWHTQAEWEKLRHGSTAYDPYVFCVVEHSITGEVINLNENHRTFTVQCTYYGPGPGGYFSEHKKRAGLKRRIPANEVPLIIKSVYEELALSLVLDASEEAKETAKRSGKYHRTEYRDAVEPDRMTFALGGFINADPAIQNRLQAR